MCQEKGLRPVGGLVLKNVGYRCASRTVDRLPGLLLGSDVVFWDVRQQAPNPFGGNPRGATAFLNRDQKSGAVWNVVQVEMYAAPNRLEDPVDMGFNIPRQPTVQTTGIQGAPEA